ncbi:LOW QUALITY PROTEIN: hypothetical protein ACHAWF_011254 [Thalassiosira exigua]
MGMALVPTIADLFVAVHGQKVLLRFLDDECPHLSSFTDDGLGIWLHHPDKITDTIHWNAFQSAVNNGGLA